MDNGTILIFVHFIFSTHSLLSLIALHLLQHKLEDVPGGINCYCGPWVMMVGIQMVSLMSFIIFL